VYLLSTHAQQEGPSKREFPESALLCEFSGLVTPYARNKILSCTHPNHPHSITQTRDTVVEILRTVMRTPLGTVSYLTLPCRRKHCFIAVHISNKIHGQSLAGILSYIFWRHPRRWRAEAQVARGAHQAPVLEVHVFDHHQ